MSNPATEFVQAAREHSPVHEYVADRGEPVDRSAIEHVTIAGRQVAVSKALTEEERKLVADAIRATKPVTAACYANSFAMWEYDSRFKYAEGFAVAADIDVGFEHAWNVLSGEKLVDVTVEFEHYHGVVIENDEMLRRYADREGERGSYGIIGNHRNRYEFLRKRGYVDG